MTSYVSGGGINCLVYFLSAVISRETNCINRRRMSKFIAMNFNRVALLSPHQESVFDPIHPGLSSNINGKGFTEGFTRAIISIRSVSSVSLLLVRRDSISFVLGNVVGNSLIKACVLVN